MKLHTIYIAEDGKRFDSESECTRYEEILAEVTKLLALWPDEEKYPELSMGRGYLQIDEKVRVATEKGLIALANKWFKGEAFTNYNYTLGRYIDDSNMTCLRTLTYKLSCLDSENRFWEQPYYAANPGQGQLNQLNK